MRKLFLKYRIKLNDRIRWLLVFPVFVLGLFLSLVGIFATSPILLWLCPEVNKTDAIAGSVNSNGTIEHVSSSYCTASWYGTSLLVSMIFVASLGFCLSIWISCKFAPKKKVLVGAILVTATIFFALAIW